MRSRNKHSRAALRAKGRRPQQRRSSRWFTVAMVVIVVLGVVGVLFLGGSDDEASAKSPTTTDHWHSALGVNVCGEWLPAPQTFDFANGTNVAAGIHTHGDGFIHIHPHANAETGDRATLGRFMSNGGWSVSDDSMDVWQGPSFAPGQTKWSDGDRCPDASGAAGAGKPGRIVFEVDCKPVSGHPAAHRLRDQEVVAIGFLPKGEEMGAPPNADAAPAVDGAEPSERIDKAGCRPTAIDNPGGAPTPTTAAADASSAPNPATTPATTPPATQQ